MDPTDVQAAVERLACAIVDQHEPPNTDRERTAARVALRNALHRIRTTVDDLDFEVAQQLTRDGHVTIRCARPECRRWFLAAGTGRRRRTCSGACRAALARTR